ncbi:MAG: fibronectin type III domain-containing protein [bacterium]|nr:fibronectin type III domain-containing protein [bacterium]
MGTRKVFQCLGISIFLMMFVLTASASPLSSMDNGVAPNNKPKEVLPITAPIEIGEWHSTEIPITDEADTPITIGTGTTQQAFPIYDFWWQVISASIYTAADIQAAGGAAGVITHLRWDCGTPSTWPARQVWIYIGTTTATTFTSQTWSAFQASYTLTEVYNSGTQNYTGPTTVGWNEWDINDFTWNGTDNLIIVVRSFRNGYASSTTPWRYSTSTGNQHIYWIGDSADLSTYTGTANANRPNIQLEMIIAPGAPFAPVPMNGATNVPTNATLSWNAGANSATFDVYFGTVNPPTTQVATGLTTTSWTPTTALNPNTTYYWYVRAFNPFGNTTGPVWSFTTGSGTAPNSPTNGSAVTITNNSMTISFTDNSTNETGFPVYISTDGNEYTLSQTLPANTGTGTVQFTLSNLNPNTRYWIRVFATGAGGTSTGFAGVNEWTYANPAAQIVLGAIGFTNVMISSIPTTDGNPPNTLYRVMVNPGVYVMAGGSPITQLPNLWTNFNVTGLVSGATYNFRAVAVNGAGVESPGPVVTVTTSDANSAGPDAYGYRYLNNNAPNGPTFEWITPGGTTIPTTTGWTSTDDGYYTTPQPLGFTLNWYGVDYTQVYLCSNGYVTFDAGYSTLGPTLTSNQPGAGILFWGRDMHVGYTNPSTDITIQTLGTAPNRYCVITFISLAQYANAAVRMDAQIIIYENGQVKVQYNNVNPSLPRGVIGIKALNGANGMNLEYAPQLTPTNQTVILYYRLGVPSNPIPANGAANVPLGTNLQWTAAAAATGYNVYFGTTNPPPLVSSNQTATTYVVNLAPTTTYYWQVVALGTGGMTNAGPVWSFTTGTGAAPNAPTNGAVTNPTTSSLTLTWSDNSNNETGFPIHRSLDDVTYTYLATAPANATTYTDNNLIPSRRYYYRVYAQNQDATSLSYANMNGVTLPVPAGTLYISLRGAGRTTAGVDSIGADANSPQVTYKVEVMGLGFLQANGTVGPAPRVAPRANWVNFAISGLTSSTTYQMRAIAISPDNVEAPGPQSSITTNSENVGGPDAFGYRFINSNAQGGPTIADWFEIAGPAGGPGTNANLTGDDQVVQVSMGAFSFSYYGAVYTGNISICTNGHVGFGNTSASYSNTALPTTAFSAPMILPYWDDLYPPSGGSIWYYYDQQNNRFIVEWYQVPHISNNQSLNTFQVQLYSDGLIKFRYQNIGALNNSATIGIQGPNGGANNYWLEHSLNTAIVTPFAIDFYRLGTPSNPLPPDGATAVPTNTTLVWNAGRAATGYDVFFGTVNPPTNQVASNQPDTTYTPTLSANTTYYWRVVSRLGNITANGPVWSFTTGTGAAPAAPTGGNITNHAITSLRMNWVDNSNNETGFIIRRSTNGTTFDSIAAVPANTTFFVNTGLSANTQYYYRVYSYNANATSINFASANSYTLAATPGVPSISGVGITSVGITVNNNTTTPNSPSTQYAIRINNQWVQTNGFLGDTATWRTLTQWGALVNVGGLVSGTTYTVRTKARNQNLIETAFSDSVTFTTTGAFQLPLTQNFQGTTFPPPDWSIYNREPGTVTWTRFTDANGAYARINFWNYSAQNHVDILWTPPITTVNIAAVRVEWDWYYQDNIGYNDTLECVYSLDGGNNWTSIWLRRGMGTGEEDLGTGTTGGVTAPGAFPNGWGHAEIFLPTPALNHPSVMIGWLGRTNFGPDVFLDNISITVTGTSYAEGYVYRSNGTPMEGVSVRIRNDWTTSTDLTGRWFLQIPAGSYPVRVFTPCFYPNPILRESVTFTVGDTARFVDTLYRPNITASTNELSFIIPPGQIASQTLTIGNTGDWPYNFTASFRRNPPTSTTNSVPMDMKVYARFVEPPLAQYGPPNPGKVKNEEPFTEVNPIQPVPYNAPIEAKRAYEDWFYSQNPSSTTVIDQTWGPDGYGYRSFDNVEPEYPTQEATYLDIRQFAPTPIIQATDDAGAAVNFPTGFSFNYYGTTYTRIWACTNGFIQFMNTGNGSTSFINTTLPSTSVTNAAFALWDDLYAAVYAYYNQTTHIFYVQWNGRRLGYNDSLNFQIQLHGDNHGIVFAYNQMNNIAVLSETVGIQGGTGTNNWYIQNYYNTHPTQYTGYGIAFADMSPGGGGGWVRDFSVLINPETGTVSPGIPVELFIQVTVDDSTAIGLIATGNIFVRTNTCDSLIIPVTVEVSLNNPQQVSNLPTEYKLHQNYPNPFNPSTEIRFDLPKDGLTKLTIYNMLGQKVAELVNQTLPAGYHSVRFDATRLAAGVYVYRLESGSFQSLRKMVLVK